jgi:hypothetical protein
MSETGKAAIKPSSANSSGGTSAQARPASNSPSAGKSAVEQAMVGRKASKARRQAMSAHGKAGVSTQDRTRMDESPSVKAGTQPNQVAAPKADADQAQRKDGCGCGCKGEKRDANQGQPSGQERPASRAGSKPKVNANIRKKAMAVSPARAASVARRQAAAVKGKAALNGNGMSTAQTARVANPQLSSRELAQAVREQRSKNGKAGGKKSEPCGRMRPGKTNQHGASQDAPWKVGYSQTSHGQDVTGTMVGRSAGVTGDEPSTCRNVTGTEYLGADIFKQFCQTDFPKGPRKVMSSPTSHGNKVTGNEVGRGERVTGNEPGTCKRVTGDEYVSANQSKAFCGTASEPSPDKITRSQTRGGKNVSGNNVGRSANVTGDETGASRELTGTQYMQRGNGQAPSKVGVSQTLRGGRTTGTLVGRSERVTGDEPGTCRNVTGDDYVGQEQYGGFCKKTPTPDDQKVGVSQTLKGERVSGTMTGRSSRVTGDEPGTCKAITGTPYAGSEQYGEYCAPDETRIAAARNRQLRSTPGMPMTGQQPGINGVLTGADKGKCEPLTGTPYVGADQYAGACPATAAEPGSADFPQAVGETPWGQFSVQSPVHASQSEADHSAVTGTRYESGHITGPFGMAGGKVTGTEDFRHGQGNGGAAMSAPAVPPTAQTVQGRVKSRITGEGMDSGLSITGDDWDRGDNVTGTEGSWAQGRNLTRRAGPMGAMPRPQVDKRNDELVEPMSPVTGGSGNTEKGALVTYSGGARG